MSPASPTPALLVQLEPNWKKKIRKVRLEGGKGTIIQELVNNLTLIFVRIAVWVCSIIMVVTPTTSSMMTSWRVKGIPLLIGWGTVSTSFLAVQCPLSMGDRWVGHSGNIDSMHIPLILCLGNGLLLKGVFLSLSTTNRQFSMKSVIDHYIYIC